MFYTYLLVALRNIARRRTISFIKIAGLAVSMTGCLFVLHFLYDELTYDMHHVHSDKIFRITQTFKTPEFVQNIRFTHQKIGPYLKRNYSQVLDFVRLEGGDAKVGKDRMKVTGFVKADPSVFDVFTYEFIEGNKETALNRPNSIVLSESVAKKFFQGSALNKDLIVDGKQYLVTGVIADPPPNSDKPISAFLAGKFGGEEDQALEFVYDTYVLLRSKTDADFIRAELENIATGLHEAAGQDVSMGYDMQALTDLHFYKGVEMDNPKGNKDNVYILVGVAFLLLLVAVINFINITAVMSIDRAKEVGIRKVSGAFGLDLGKQFLVEAFAAVMMAVFAAIVLTLLLGDLYTSITSKVIRITSLRDIGILSSMLAGLIAIVLIASSYPAILLARFKPAAVLKGKTDHSGKVLFLQRSFTVGQFALSTTLLVFLTTMLFQMDFIKETDTGFTTDKIVVVKTPENFEVTNPEVIKTELLRNRVVQAVSVGGFASNFGTTEPFASPLWVGHGANEQQLIIPNIVVDREYVKMLNLSLKFGQSFEEFGNSSIEGKALVNEAFVKRLRLTNPIGEKVRTYAGEATVVGVLKNFHFQSLHNVVEPMVIMGMSESRPDARNFFLKIDASSMTELLPHLALVFGEMPEYFFLDEFYQGQYRTDKNLSMMLIFFAVLTIGVAVSGLFALVLYQVSLRYREICIRRVLGADISGLVLLLSSHFAKLVAAGIILGTMGGSYISKEWLHSFAYRMELSALHLAAPAFLMIIIAALIVGYKTYRASVINPSTILKSE